MSKPLSEMTLEELWRLFPIALVESRSHWAEQFARERNALSERLPDDCRISHIGSTAIGGIRAKDIVDILVELPSDRDLRAQAERLSALDYTVMSQNDARVSLCKGYTERGFADRVFHLHLRYIGDCDEIAFRDYLIAHSDVARAYESLKSELSETYRYDRDAYTQAKGDFVRRYTELAKEERRASACAD